MKKKLNFLSIVFAVLAFSSCDMDLLQKPFTPTDVSYLTIINLPAHVRQEHVSNMSVSNQSRKISGCPSYDEIIIENKGDTSSLKIPLVYNDTKLRFDATGSYFVSLDINVDVFTRYSISENENFPLDFTNGNALLDASLIGYTPYSYFTIVNLPANTLKNHFSNVFVFNSAGVIAKCSDYNKILIIKENSSVTAKIPLSYNAGSDFFKETGTFVVSFTANVDYATCFIVKETDKLRLYFTEGNATFDASLIPPPPPPYLTIISLPRNTNLQNISNVFVYNASGSVVAKCADYDQIIIIRDSFSVTAKIPLYYNDRNEHFIDTGVFIVSLYVNINFNTQIIVKEDDKLSLFFTDGNALLDASLIPAAPPPPYLTITSLPKNTKTQNLSNVFVYNVVGTAIARCADYNQIIITTDSDYAAAKIPLVYNNNGSPFRDSGNFIVSFTLNIDSYIQISKTRDDSFYVAFTEGSGAFDLLNNALSSIQLGYFSGGLANPSDTAAPVIRSGTTFEMNGNYYTVNSNTAVVPSSFSNTCICYVYARLVFNQIEFYYSTTAPVYDSYKKGYYSGLSRSLFKFIFILDSTNKYFAKIFINNNWSHLNYQTVESDALASRNLFQHYYLSGVGNPQSHTVTLSAGIYLFTLNGAAGGNGDNFNNNFSNASGGSGGHISEVVILTQNTSFTFFTGEYGRHGRHGSNNPSGNDTRYDNHSGGGGGSGSFAFSPDGYFLCAGGGGGGTGHSTTLNNGSYTTVSTSGGGAGGSIGGGGAGSSPDFPSNTEAMGGSGGGINGGTSLSLARPYGISELTVYSYSLGYSGTPSSNGYAAGSAAYFNLPSPYNWLNTNDANGKGGGTTGAAQSGGNNRNSIRGGGGTPVSIYNQGVFSTVSVGSITVHKIN